MSRRSATRSAPYRLGPSTATAWVIGHGTTDRPLSCYTARSQRALAIASAVFLGCLSADGRSSACRGGMKMFMAIPPHRRAGSRARGSCDGAMSARCEAVSGEFRVRCFEPCLATKKTPPRSADRIIQTKMTGTMWQPMLRPNCRPAATPPTRNDPGSR